MRLYAFTRDCRRLQESVCVCMRSQASASVYMSLHAFVCVHESLRAFTRVYLRLYAFTRVCERLQEFTCVCMRSRSLRACTRVCMRLYAFTRVCERLQEFTCVCMRSRARLRTVAHGCPKILVSYRLSIRSDAKRRDVCVDFQGLDSFGTSPSRLGNRTFEAATVVFRQSSCDRKHVFCVASWRVKSYHFALK